MDKRARSHGPEAVRDLGRESEASAARGAVALLIVGILAGCAGGGGGGSGSGGNLRSRSFFETEEYFASIGLDVVGASAVYAEGATGEGITVGVIDTGIDVDHSEFAGAIDGDSIDIVGGSVASLEDVSGHGTAVAGLIGARRNQALSHGVAFDSRLLAIRADAPGSCPAACAFDQADVARATDHAVAHGARVINYSLGGTGSLASELGDAMEAAAGAGRILVLSAGNDGVEGVTFPATFAGTAAARGQAIAVGALDANGDIASFSNRPGAATQDYFLLAPGDRVLAPALGGGAALVSGTSFAAPHVSGAAALILQAAPFLDAAEVVDLLLATATDLGEPGTDPIYGRGQLDLEAALGPQGPLGVPLGHTVEGSRVEVAATGLRLGGAFGSGPGLGRAILLDGYGRPYWFDLDQHRASTRAQVGLRDWLAPGGEALTFSAPYGKGAKFSLHLARTEADSRSGARWRPGGPEARLDGRFALGAALGDASVAIVRGWSLEGHFGLGGDQPNARQGLLSGASFGSPYLAFADGGDGLALSHGLGRGWAVRVGLARAQSSQGEPYGSGESTLLIGEIVRAQADRWLLALQFGQLDEQDRLLASSGGGALGLPDASSTAFFGVAGRATVATDLQVFGQGSLGFTRPGNAGRGLLRDVSMLHSSSLAVGVALDHAVVSGDRLTLGVSQPLRVEAGEAELDRPVGRTFGGRIVRRRDQVGLAPAGREVDLEVGYRFAPLWPGELSLNWLTQLQPGHDPDARPAHAVALRLHHRF